MEENKSSEIQISPLDSLFNQISNIKKQKDLDKFKEELGKLNENAEKISLSMIQKFIILFYNYYNDFTFKEQNNYIGKLIRLAKIMINNIKKPKILNLIQSEINTNFYDDFKNYKIFADKYVEKDCFEICFSLCILSKNIELMYIFFTKYFEVSLFDEDKFKSLNLNNPITSTLFNSIFISIYKEIKNNKSKNFDSEIIKNCLDDSNISLYNMLRCNKCYEINMIKLNRNKNFDMKCAHCDKKYNEYTELQINSTIKSEFSCYSCNNTLLLYEENIKCAQCKKLFCPMCKNKHIKKSFCLNYIKLYEVGYRCELHNSRYIEYCFECKQNLCIRCKEIHPHKINKIMDIDILIIEFYKKYKKYQDETRAIKNSEEYKKLQKDLPKEENLEITKNLCMIYEDKKKQNLFNGYIYEVICQLLNKDLGKMNEDILFNKFNGEEFRKYYSELIKGIEDGNQYFLNCLDSIKSFYINKNKKKFEYKKSKFVKREESQQAFIENCKLIWNDLSNLHRFFEYDCFINELKESNNKLKIKVDELCANYLILNNSNEILLENTHNILCRFLADELLQSIIMKYHDKLEPISLNLNIFLDIILKSDYDVISNKNILKSICIISTELSNALKELEKNPSNNELKNEIIRLIGSKSKIQFIDDIIINDETFKKEDLNKILDILFFIKNFGNITAHPNLSLGESLKMLNIQNLPLNFEIDYLNNNELNKKIKENFEKINNKIKDITLNLFEDEDEIYYQINKNNIEVNLDYNLINNLNNYRNSFQVHINEKLEKLRNNLLKNFNICKIRKKVEAKGIFDIIFNDNDKIIFENSPDFMKTLISDTDNAIKKFLELNLSKEFLSQNKNINKLIKILGRISSMFEDFFELKIPKHNALKEYIEDENLNEDFDYSDFIYFINKDLKIKLSNVEEFELDCLKNDIYVEACFLLLIKTYENEIILLKSIIKDYETEIIKNIFYEEIESKLNNIINLFDKRFNKKNSTTLKKSIRDNFNDTNFDNIKNIINKIICEPIPLDKSENSKLNATAKLFYYQNAE